MHSAFYLLTKVARSVQIVTFKLTSIHKSKSQCYAEITERFYSIVLSFRASSVIRPIGLSGAVDNKNGNSIEQNVFLAKCQP